MNDEPLEWTEGTAGGFYGWLRGVYIGKVGAIADGSTWLVITGGQVQAVRPDLESAKECLSRIANDRLRASEQLYGTVNGAIPDAKQVEKGEN
jgi:hypothetical protein